MKIILESYNQRQLDIIYILYSSDDWMTINDISALLNVTKQTINNDIKKINSLNEEQLLVETSIQLGVRMRLISEQDLIQLNSTILRQSTGTRFIRSIFFHPDKNLNYHAEALYTSRSTLHRYISIINEVLKPFDITIKQSNKGLFLHSEKEDELRRFFAILLYEIFGFDNSFFIEADILSTIKKRIQHTFSTNDYALTGDYNAYLQNLYYVSLLREAQQFSLTDIHVNTYQNTNCIQLTDENFSLVETFLLNHFLGSIVSSKHKKKLTLIDSHVKDTIINNWIVPDNGKVAFFTSSLKTIYLSIVSSNIPNVLISDSHQTFVDEIKEHYPNLHNLLLNFIHQLENIVDLSFQEDIDRIIFYLFISFPEIIDVAYAKTILVISSHSIEHAEFLKKVICNYIDLNTHFIHHLVCLTEDDDYSTRDYKLIITNSRKIHKFHKNSFLVNSYPSDQSLTEIRRLLASKSMYLNEF